MELNRAPRAVRVHIAFFGMRNAGKSSLINALTGQETAIVSPVKGTTTDPVYKSMEILPLGPCVLIDTAGLDDDGELGQQRRQKSLEVLEKTDLAVFVADATRAIAPQDKEILQRLKERGLPLLVVRNKCDAATQWEPQNLAGYGKVLSVSCRTGEGIPELLQELAAMQPAEKQEVPLVGDLIEPGDCVVLVTPIDSSAPKGRMILPQQQVLRDILDHGGVAFVTREHELAHTLSLLKAPPKLVITDSQAFAKVAQVLPKDQPLTSFSILFARKKGDLAQLVRGLSAVKQLKAGDRVLIAEACTHHRQEEDIGKVKIPAWLRKLTGCEPEFVFASGGSFASQLKDCALAVHCGACMINRQAMQSRLQTAEQQQVPIVNYGIFIAYATGVLQRAIMPFPQAAKAFEECGL